jgi:hypothetical protein
VNDKLPSQNYFNNNNEIKIIKNKKDYTYNIN